MLTAARIHLSSLCFIAFVQRDVDVGKERVCKAHHLADVSQELAMLIRARQKLKSDNENEECAYEDQRLPVDKARKIARMNKIRQIEGIPDAAPVVVCRQPSS